MIVSNQQLRQFDGIGSQNFQTYMLGHLQEHFPAHSQYMSQKGLLDLIVNGCEEAGQYGFTTRYEVCLYIDTMMMLGAGFDTDIQLPWARKIIKPVMATDPRAKIDELIDTTFEYLDEVVEPGGVFPEIQYELLMEAELQLWSDDTGIQDEEEVLKSFREIWPAKYLHVGEPVLKKLMFQAGQVAAKFGLTNRVSVEFFALLMFVFGHEFYCDPAFAGLVSVLQTNDQFTEFDLYQQLFKATQERVSAYLNFTGA